MRQYVNTLMVSALLAGFAMVASVWSPPAAALQAELHNCSMASAYVSVDGGNSWERQWFIFCDEGEWYIGSW